MPCNYTLSLWNPEQYAACKLDNYHLESMSHILNGCKQLQKNYTKWHDRILEKIADELKIKGKSIFVNKTSRTTFEQLLCTEFKDQGILDSKPDLVVKNEDKSMTIIEIACPYDLYIENTYKDKIEKYLPLKAYLTSNGFGCEIKAIMIGSLGTVHHNAITILFKLGLSKRPAKGLSKWCSTSAIIGAKIIWNIRCRLAKD